MHAGRFSASAIITIILTATFLGPARVQAWQAPAKPTPDGRSGNWLYRTPDPKVWTKTEKDGAVVFSTDLPPGDFCTLTLFPGAPFSGDFGKQFAAAVDADQKAKGTVKIEADGGPQPSRAADGFAVLTRNLRSETATMHTYHLYVSGNSKDRFDLAAFQTSTESAWNQHAAEATEFLSTLKLANSLPDAAVNALAAKPPAGGPPPPALPGLAFGAAEPGKPQPAAVTAPTPAATPPAAARPEVAAVPVESSPIVLKDPKGGLVVGQKNGKGVDGVKLSQHDTEIGSPSIAVAPDGTLHVAFVEKHRTTYAYAAYHRSSSDGGKTWSEAKNLTEDDAGIGVGMCKVLVDGSGRVYVVWRSGLDVNFSASINPWGDQCTNLRYRVLDHGKWSKARLIHPPGSRDAQGRGAVSYTAMTDPTGKVHVLWNSNPDDFHPELVNVSGAYRFHCTYVGYGLLFQSTLDGGTVGTPREIFMPPVTGSGATRDAACDGLNSLDGYVDAAGTAHLVAAVRSGQNPVRGKSRYGIIENGRYGAVIDLPELSFHEWMDIPRLLRDASGHQHVIAMYRAGERPAIRDYLVGSDDDPAVIRAAAPVKGTIDAFQAIQGPGGRMVAFIQANDTGELGDADTFLFTSTGDGKWSDPVNLTNNSGRKRFASRQTSSESHVAVETNYIPGVTTAAYDATGHLLIVMINSERSLVASTAFGVNIAGGSTSTPTLRFLRL